MLAVVLASAAAATACTSSAPAANPSAPSLAEASAVLAAQARAVLAHSVSGYLAAVDPTTSAAAFRTQERTDITDLAHVPLASWRYTGAETVHDPSATSTATKRYGAPTLIVHVTLEYALAQVDPLPARHTLYLSFVRRDGRVLVSGNDALAAGGSTSWVAPWRFGPLSAARGQSCLVLGPPDADLAAVARAVDAAVPQVSAVWGTEWNRQVAVLVTNSDAAFDAAVGTPEHLQDVSAAAVTGGIDPVSRRAYGQRLVLAPDALGTLSSVGEQIVLRHELTHLATAAVTDPTTPRWVVEGFADYVGNLGSGQSVDDAAAELRSAVRAGRVPTALPDDAAFASSGVELAGAYEQAWLACRLIAARAGQHGLVHFYTTVSAALLPVPQALARGLDTAVHLSLAGFTAQWRGYLRDELG